MEIEYPILYLRDVLEESQNIVMKAFQDIERAFTEVRKVHKAILVTSDSKDIFNEDVY